jgi:hypothetical protein
MTMTYRWGKKLMAGMFGVHALLLVVLASCGPAEEEKPLPEKSSEVVTLPTVPGRAEAGMNESRDVSGKGEEIRVLWQVSGFVPGPQAAMGRAEAEAMRGRPLDIGKDRIVFGRQACRGVSFKSTKERLRDYLERVYKVTPRELGVADEVITVIKTNCSLPGFQEYVRLGDRKLVICVKGVFFFLEPEISRAQ